MFIVTPDGEHIVNTDHVQEINRHTRDKCKIMATYSSGRPILLAEYQTYQEADMALMHLVMAITDKHALHRMDVPSEPRHMSPIPNGSGSSARGYRAVGKTK